MSAGEGLSHVLRSLCNRTGWCYAVFWKLKRRSRMVLTWEDSYNEFAAAAGAHPLHRSSNMRHDGGIAEDQIQLAVAKMSYQVYALGEGTIGRVAFSGKHQWVFAAGDRCMENGVSSPLENGWANQFSAGIKTIAVIAVQQQGVVQLGSTQTMSEDLNFIGQIRALFGGLQSIPGALVPDFVPDGQSGRCVSVAKSMSSYGSKPISTLTALTGHSCDRTSMNSAALCPGSGEGPSLMPKPVEPVFQSAWSFPCTHNLQTTSTSGLTSRSGHGFEEVAKHPPAAAMPTPVESLFHSADTGRLSSFTGELSYGQRDEISGWPPPDSALTVRDYDHNMALPSCYGEEVGMVRPAQDEGFDYNSLFKAFQKDDLDDFNNLLASLNKEYPVDKQASAATSSSQFAFGDELSEVVVCHPKCGPSKEEVYVNKPAKLVLPFDAPQTVMDRGRDAFVSLSADRPEQLLDAVVASASAAPTLASKLPMPSALPGKTALPSVPPLTVGNAVQYLEKQLSSSSSLDRDLAANWPASSVSVDVSSSSWTEGSQSKLRREEQSCSKETSGASLPLRKPEEANRMVGRKRLRPGEAPRPRPKDRQQIQDRVRELRDIVPNATKCSIDALLEKTIRHMKFLQSVTQHGDKWKVKGESDADNSGGSSWALEVDAKGNGVPILVENLKQPRQMLVEMLCEERGLFWEIAESIRGLGLTILKGVMESRNDKVWARFNVEMHPASEVNRLKVVWNLTQLLKPSGKNGSDNATSSLTGSEMSDVCYESFGTRFQSHGITVSPGGAAGGW